ncbi:MAG: DUF4255 domain-containing protein [Acidobacteria bacterium]|nr:DUF4255 domain-containing protein [Acidobacteriota bacterium]
MSSYKVIAEVSKKLRGILWGAFQADNEINPAIIGNEQAIVFSNPTQTARDSANRLSLWLYEITENEFMKNQPQLRGDDHRTTQFPPLVLNLFYLVTPFATDGESDHLLLGKTMQVLYDNAIALLRDANDEIAEEMRIILCRLTLEELTRIWEALREPYRLSVCYQVRVVKVESQRLAGQGRITERGANISDNPS